MSASIRVRLLRLLANWLAGKTPAQRLTLARRLQPLVSWLASKRVRVARVNLRLCFPDMTATERSVLLARSLLINVKGLLDAAVAWYAVTLEIDEIYEVVGLEHLQRAINRGDGVMILSGHFHGSELHMRAVAALSGRPVMPMVRAFSADAIDREINAQRRRWLGEVIERGDVRALCAAVRRGDTVVYTPDVNVRTRNVFAPFFGVPASTLDAIATILRRAGGTIVPVSAMPLPDGRYRLIFEAPPAEFPGADGLNAAVRYNAWLEARVRQVPEAYDWGVKRFKTRPAGEAGLYDQPL